MEEDRIAIGRSPDAGVFLDDVTVSRNHALLVARGDGTYIDDLGSLNGTYVNRKPDRVAAARGRRRDSGRQVQAQRIWRSEMTVSATDRLPTRARWLRARPRKALTIGAVAKLLSKEFDDVSISKIRYLEDQKLVTPRRTRAATGSTARLTSTACAPSCDFSATSSCRFG